MERSLRYAPVAFDHQRLATKLHECWPSLQRPEQFAKYVAEVAMKIDPQSAFYFPPSESLDRGVFVTRYAAYPVDKQINQPTQEVAYLVLGIPFDPSIEPSYRKIVESKSPLEEVNANLQILRGLSPYSKRVGKVDQVFQAFRLQQREETPGFLSLLETRGHIAIYNPTAGTLQDWNYGETSEPVTAVLNVLDDVLSGLGSLHRADLVHGNLCGSSCSIDLPETEDEVRSVSLSLVHLAKRLGEPRQDFRRNFSDYRAPWVWREGILGQVRGELVAPNIIDKTDDLFAFGKMIQREIIPGLLIHFGDHYNYPTRPLLAQYYHPQRIAPYEYSDGDLRWFESQNPGRVHFGGTNEEGKMILRISHDPEVIFQKTLEVIGGLSVMVLDEEGKKELKLLRSLSVFARDLQEPDYIKFIWNILGEEGFEKENRKDYLVRVLRNRLSGILEEERPPCPIPPLDFGRSQLDEDPIEEIDSSGSVTSSPYIPQSRAQRPRMKFLLPTQEEQGSSLTDQT